MLRQGFVMLMAVAAAVAVAPAEGSAQGRGHAPARASQGPAHAWGRDRDGGWDPRDERDRDRDSDRGRDRDQDRDRDGRWEGRRTEARGRGPAFCRSGAGHPVHGRRWCVDKGFGLGRRGDLDRRRDSLEDILGGIPRREPRPENRSRGSVIDVLEDVLSGRAGSGGR